MKLKTSAAVFRGGLCTTEGLNTIHHDYSVFGLIPAPFRVKRFQQERIPHPPTTFPVAASLTKGLEIIDGPRLGHLYGSIGLGWKTMEWPV